MKVYSLFVKSSASQLSPLVRSNAQGDILALLLLHPDNEYSLAEIGQRTGALPATVHREVSRLVVLGLLRDRYVGRTRLISANPESSFYRPMTEIIAQTHGPRPVLEDLLTGLPGVESAFIYGSWAARHAGVPGQPPNDVDVLVIGSPSRNALGEVAGQASRTIGREVNIHRVTRADWESGQGTFESTVKSRPMLELKLGGIKE